MNKCSSLDKISPIYQSFTACDAYTNHKGEIDNTVNTLVNPFAAVETTTVTDAHTTVASVHTVVTSVHTIVTDAHTTVTAVRPFVTSVQSFVTAGRSSVTTGHRSVTAGRSSVTTGHPSVTAGRPSVTAGCPSVTVVFSSNNKVIYRELLRYTVEIEASTYFHKAFANGYFRCNITVRVLPAVSYYLKIESSVTTGRNSIKHL